MSSRTEARCARPEPAPSDPSTLVSAPLPRRSFLGLSATLAASWLVGCGDDSPIADGGGSSGSSSTGSDSGLGMDSTGMGSTTEDSLDDTGFGTGSESDGGSESTGDTGEEPACMEDGVEEAFDAEAIPLDEALFPYAVMAGEMKPTSALLAVQIPDAEPKLLRVWRVEPGEEALIVAEQTVTPNADGYVKVPLSDLCPGTWYQYAYFTGEPGRLTARSRIGQFRTAFDEDSQEPLRIAMTACNGNSFDWPALDRTAEEYYDVFIHLGDMAYNDGAFSLEEFREIWQQYMSAGGFGRCFAGAGLYATWDDHEIDNNSNFDRETMDPMQLQKRQNALDAYFERLPIEAEGPDYQLWRSFRWGLTAEIFVLDCRYERRPSMGQYMSEEQLSWLEQRLLESPCHFKIIMNSVPITNMPLVWDVAAGDRWEGYPQSRDRLLGFIEDNLVANVWFLSGDFHTCFVSRIEPSGGGLVSITHEIAVTGGRSNPLPDFLTGFDSPQFDYGVTVPRGCLLEFDPVANTVNVRFIDPETGEDAFNETLSQVL